jgi:EAL domain-containing protein (putative c-di-GMP-specific phosphodiesterase class I)/PAS domain-containing protein
MQEPIRVVLVEHSRIHHGNAAQLLTEHNLDFSWQQVATPRELSEVAENFKPHIVLCTDGAPNQGLLDALRLLCSQTPVILVSSLHEKNSAKAGRNSSRALAPGVRIQQTTADLRQGFSAVLESSAAPAVISDAEGWITHANTRACQLLGSRDRRVVTVLSSAPDQCPPMPHWLALSPPASPSDGATPERCQYRLAYFDSWSLLPTLVHMDDLIDRLTVGENDARAALAVIAMDRGGNRIPDDARRGNAGSGMASESAPFGSIVRISADDFLVVLPDPARPADAAITMQRVLDSIAEPRSLTRTVHPDAMAKCGRRVPEPQAAGLDAALDDAMNRHALSVLYQPHFDLKTGRGCGVEALARWMRGSGEDIAPSVFIPLAERSGLIHTLGAWMLKSACDTAYPWCGREAQRTTLSVNVSATQVEQFGAVIQRTLEKSGFPARQLELEIAESTLIANPDVTIECLNQWKELGVRIALDDFGAGGSSLTYLSRLPVDRLKLDQSLIHRMTQDPTTAAVTRLIVSLGAELGIDIIAKGVETEQQLQMLADLDCPRVQGYLLGRPMPAQQAQLALRKTWGDRPVPMHSPPKAKDQFVARAH